MLFLVISPVFFDIFYSGIFVELNNRASLYASAKSLEASYIRLRRDLITFFWGNSIICHDIVLLFICLLKTQI
jgi:hypothetical protein